MTETSIFFLATEKTGGLFDLDGTLALVGIQFLALMFLLNFILYTPLLNVINDRNQYISKNLANASTSLSQYSQRIKEHEIVIAKARKEGRQQEIILKKEYKKKLDRHISSWGSFFEDSFFVPIARWSKEDKKRLLAHLENEIDSLSDQIISKILA